MSVANFAPYQPPPDDRQRALLANAAASSRSSNSSSPAPPPPPKSAAPVPPYAISGRPSYGEDEDADYESDPRYATESYQSSTPASAVPQHSYASATSAQPAWAAGGASSTAQVRPQPGFGSAGGRPDHLSFATAHGWNLSNLCFAAWALPPFSSVLLLIVETENDLVRFHAYQGGLFGVTAVITLWIMRSIFGWKTLSIIIGMGALGYSWVCGSNAANAAPTLARSPYLPIFGPLAEQWLGEE